MADTRAYAVYTLAQTTAKVNFSSDELQAIEAILCDKTKIVPKKLVRSAYGKLLFLRSYVSFDQEFVKTCEKYDEEMHSLSNTLQEEINDQEKKLAELYKEILQLNGRSIASNFKQLKTLDVMIGASSSSLLESLKVHRDEILSKLPSDGWFGAKLDKKDLMEYYTHMIWQFLFPKQKECINRVGEAYLNAIDITNIGFDPSQHVMSDATKYNKIESKLSAEQKQYLNDNLVKMQECLNEFTRKNTSRLLSSILGESVANDLIRQADRNTQLSVGDFIEDNVGMPLLTGRALKKGAKEFIEQIHQILYLRPLCKITKSSCKWATTAIRKKEYETQKWQCIDVEKAVGQYYTKLVKDGGRFHRLRRYLRSGCHSLTSVEVAQEGQLPTQTQNDSIPAPVELADNTRIPSPVLPTSETLPNSSPEVTPETLPNSSPEVTPETLPNSSPEVTPETLPNSSPEVTPETHQSPRTIMAIETHPNLHPVAGSHFSLKRHQELSQNVALPPLKEASIQQKKKVPNNYDNLTPIEPYHHIPNKNRSTPVTSTDVVTIPSPVVTPRAYHNPRQIATAEMYPNFHPLMSETHPNLCPVVGKAFSLEQRQKLSQNVAFSPLKKVSMQQKYNSSDNYDNLTSIKPYHPVSNKLKA